jgi:hypothetical protein
MPPRAGLVSAGGHNDPRLAPLVACRFSGNRACAQVAHLARGPGSGSDDLRRGEPFSALPAGHNGQVPNRNGFVRIYPKEP